MLVKKFNGGKNMEKERCFIITPIGNKNDEIRRHIDGIIDAVIKPVIENDYEVVVSHKISDLGRISKQIIKEIYNDKLVIANLTTINPNVMYELAFRHSIGKPVVIIAEEGTPLPFDISDERTIFYKNDAQGTLDLQDDLRTFIDKIDFEQPSGPIQDIMSEIGQETYLLNNTTNTSDVDESNSLKYILDRLNSIESSIKSIQQPKDNSEIRRLFTTIFTYEDCNEAISETQILNKLKDISSYEKNYEIFAVSLDTDNKQIKILTLKNSKVFTSTFYGFCVHTLEKLGFTGIELARRT